MLRPSSLRPLARPSCRRQCFSPAIRSSTTRRPFSGRGSRIRDEFDLNKLNTQRRDYERHRTAFLAAGAVAGVISFVYTALKLRDALSLQREKERLATKCDSPIPTETFKTEAGEKRKIVVVDEDGRVVVPTGNSVVTAFPRTIDVLLPPLSSGADEEKSPITASLVKNQGDEFTLVGLGMRTVTFLGFEVYLVGFYVATQDVAKLQQCLVRKINQGATTLIPSEKDALRKALQDYKEGEETWESLLRESGCRSLFRIVPVRDTDFHHLRDGFVRAITARSARDSKSYGDEAFGAAMRDFKAIFNRGSVPKKKEMLLCRDEAGNLSIMYGGGQGQEPRRDVLGTVSDERISRLLWLNYLAGSKVASEPARQNIIEGVMEFVERPVGTVATQVV